MSNAFLNQLPLSATVSEMPSNYFSKPCLLIKGWVYQSPMSSLGVTTPVLLVFQRAHPQQEGLEGDRCQSERFPADEPEWREITRLSVRILALFAFL